MPQQFLTEKDVQDYGSDLIDFAQRAAVHAVGPHIENLQNQNYALRDRLAQEARRNLDQRVAALLPDYAERDQDPRWHDWLRQRDNLSGRVRQELLNDAIASTDAHRVVAFFRTFQNQAAGQAASPAGRAASHTYGRARPAPSGTIYTRDQVARLYRQHQQGAYRGREAEWARQEADIIRASAEGRILGGVDVSGK